MKQNYTGAYMVSFVGILTAIWLYKTDFHLFVLFVNLVVLQWDNNMRAAGLYGK